MKTREAIMGLSQSEKLKSGIIWVSQVLQVFEGMTDQERQGASKVVIPLLHMMAHEARLGMTLAENSPGWEKIDKHLDQAVAMISSGVGPESVVHLTQALSQVTSLGQRSMSHLVNEGLL